MTPSNERVARFLQVTACALAVLDAGSAAAQSDGARIRGRVADQAGTAVADFPVLVIDGSGRAVPLRTGRDGRFGTIGLAAGGITVRLDAQGYGEHGVRCRVRSGQTAFVELFAAETSATLPSPARCSIDPSTSDVYIID